MRNPDIADYPRFVLNAVANAPHSSETAMVGCAGAPGAVRIDVRGTNIAEQNRRMRANAPALTAEKSRYSECPPVRRPSWSRPSWQLSHSAAVWVHPTPGLLTLCSNQVTPPNRVGETTMGQP